MAQSARLTHSREISRGVHVGFTLVCYANSNDGIPIEEFGDPIDLPTDRRPSAGDPSTNRYTAMWIPDSRFAAQGMTFRHHDLRRASDVRTPPMKKGHPDGWPFAFQEPT